MEAEMRRAVLLLALLISAAACGSQGSAGPWLTDPGVNGHAKFFPLAGTPHDPTAAGTTVSCDACHPGTTFAQFDCITCHTAAKTDPLHTGVSGYTHTSAGCFSCHPTGSSSGMPPDHDTRLFPRGTGSKHAGISCSQCHTDLTQASNPANFACASCHNGIAGFAGKHDPINGVGIVVMTTCSNGTRGTTAVLLTSENCLRCHGDSQVFRVASHPGGESAFGNGTHQAAGCLTCHVAMRTDKTFATDFVKSGASQGSAGCATCHNNGCGGGG
jgi:hypothetical protein